MSLHLGKWIAICDRCGLRYLSSELQKDWQGLMVCKNDYEARHPADLIRVPSETAIPSWTRPEAEDEFLFYCDVWSSQARADFGTADCMTVGVVTPIEILIGTFNPLAIAEIAITGRTISGVTS